jgi:hypothetical protein
MIQYYRNNPEAFVVDIIFNKNAVEYGGDLYLSNQQKEILNSLVGCKRISARSGRGIGKTATSAFIILWFLCTRDYPEIVCTAPTFKQLNDVLWPELGKWLRGSLVKDVFEWTSKRIYLKENPTNWFATAVTANKPESFQGYHSEHMLLVVDEASGIPDIIWDTIQGSLTQEDNIALLIGNPTQTSGFFFDSHNKNRDLWKCFKFSSEESPFVSKDMISDYEIRYGRDHDLFKVHVLGEFPSGSPDAFISLDSVMRAVNREVPIEGVVQIGVDVAHFGDDLTALAWRMGNKVFPIQTKAQTTIPDVTGLTLSLVKKIRAERNYTDKIKVCVDTGGIGAGVVDELSLDRENNIEVVPVNFGSTGDNLREYKASVLWDTLKQQINHISLPDDDALIAELSTRKFKITPSGKIRIQPKAEFKKDYGKSPDRADAVILCFADVKNEETVLKGFDHLDPTIVNDLSKMGYLVDGEKYCTVFQSKDRVFSVLCSIWIGGRLIISDDFVSTDSVYDIVKNMVPKGPFKKIVGNDRMFGNFGDDVSSQFRKYNVLMYENYRYDEAGAIEALNLLINSKRLKINNGCGKLIGQLRNWSFNKNKSTMESDYGLCYSLLHVISELRDQIIRKEEPILNLIPYSKEKELIVRSADSNKKLNKNKWQYW